MFPQGGDYSSDTYQNAPNLSMMFTMYTTTFGNGSFNIQAPPSIDDVQSGFPQVPDLPIEAIFYQQQSSNPNYSATNSVGGNTGGNTNIASQQAMTDQTGVQRVSIGLQPSNPGQ